MKEFLKKKYEAKIAVLTKRKNTILEKREELKTYPSIKKIDEEIERLTLLLNELQDSSDE